MNNDFLIRSFQEKDFSSILQIEKAGQIIPWSEKMLRDSLVANHQVWVLQNKQLIVGFIIFYIIAGECHILNFCVDPTQRGKGLGKRLLQYVVQYAKEHRADMILLEVRQSNCVALTLYQQLGFNEIGIRKNYYMLPQNKGRENAILLALELHSYQDK